MTAALTVRMKADLKAAQTVASTVLMLDEKSVLSLVASKAFEKAALSVLRMVGMMDYSMVFLKASLLDMTKVVSTDFL